MKIKRKVMFDKIRGIRYRRKAIRVNYTLEQSFYQYFADFGVLNKNGNFNRRYNY